MLSPNQITTLMDYCRLFRAAAERAAADAKENPGIDTDLRQAIIKEQNRRARELQRLETALAAEMEHDRRKSTCPTSTDRPDTAPEAKRKGRAGGKKSRKLADGIYGTDISAKNTNASPRKRKHPGTNG